MTNEKKMTKFIKHITAWCLILSLYASFTISDSYAAGCCPTCPFSGISLTLTPTCVGCDLTTYNFNQTSAMNTDAVVTGGVGRTCTIDFPAGTNALTATIAGSTCNGGAITAFTTQTAIQLIFDVPTTIPDNTSFTIVIANVTNGDGLSANCTVSMVNDAGGGCINQGTTYAFTTSACPTLSAGDIAIIGMNADNPDEFTFVALVDIAAGEEIRFTDNGWLSSTTPESFRAGEGYLT